MGRAINKGAGRTQPAPTYCSLGFPTKIIEKGCAASITRSCSDLDEGGGEGGLIAGSPRGVFARQGLQNEVSPSLRTKKKKRRERFTQRFPSCDLCREKNQKKSFKQLNPQRNQPSLSSGGKRGSDDSVAGHRKERVRRTAFQSHK